jgi:enoyl-CoA hydratase/carnithine racemase
MRRSRQAIFDAPFPVIAMIRGYCVGGGLALASECDFRIASDDSQLGIPPSKLGIIYDYERIQVFTELVGPSFTKELFCLGRRVSAERALMMGLVNEVVPASRLHETVYGMAQEFASNAPLSVRGHKRIVNTLTRRGFEGSALSQHDIDEIHEMQRIARASEDAQEGPRAFREKRTPVFTGR